MPLPLILKPIFISPENPEIKMGNRNRSVGHLRRCGRRHTRRSAEDMLKGGQGVCRGARGARRLLLSKRGAKKARVQLPRGFLVTAGCCCNCKAGNGTPLQGPRRLRGPRIGGVACPVQRWLFQYSSYTFSGAVIGVNQTSYFVTKSVKSRLCGVMAENRHRLHTNQKALQDRWRLVFPRPRPYYVQIRPRMDNFVAHLPPASGRRQRARSAPCTAGTAQR